jgi:hypothetical protein
MELQQFGTIEIEGKPVDAMMCIDSDRLDEATLHWWGDGIQQAAIAIKLNRTQDGLIDLGLLTIYRTTPAGSLWVPTLSEEELNAAKELRGVLRQMGDGFEGEWSGNSGRGGRILLSPRQVHAPIEPEACANWSEFKEWANRSRQKYDAVQFRGHGNNTFQLRTTIHRANMHRLERYCSGMLLEFRGHAEAILDAHINMEDGDDYSMLLGLAQHHGLPTPLLDWTTSPYIAAFFAFADAVESAGTRTDVTHVRIFGLTREFTTRFFTRKISVPYYKPYIAPLSIGGRKNARLYAQQGQFLVTNVADLENFIRDIEIKMKKRLIVAADIPVDCAIEALEDLQFMGLSAATMFPGLDGVCRMMKHSMQFRRQPIGAAGEISGDKQG